MLKMLIKTKHFGEVDLEDDKILYFESGVLGFEEYKKYTLLFDDEDGERSDISWLQSLEEASLAIPVISPFLVKSDYNPEVEDELLKPLGAITQENIAVLVTITVPAELEKISANLKAPFIINTDTKKGTQIIVDNPDYEVKYCFYDQLKATKEGK